MSAANSRKVVALLLAASLGVGCTNPGSSSGGARWPWTKSKTPDDEEKRRNADVLGTPPPPKQAKAGVHKPSLSSASRADSPATVTLRSPRIIDDREVDRAAR